MKKIISIDAGTCDQVIDSSNFTRGIIFSVDASLSTDLQEQRRAPRIKYVARPDPALVNRYKDNYVSL